MNTVFKITSLLLREVRCDLARQHRHAAERVGWIGAGLVGCGEELLVLAQDYRPVEDSDYLKDRSVGAMMGPDAIRKAREWAMSERLAVFHVHSHGGQRIPAFSRDDVEGHEEFMRNFFGVAPTHAHGAIVLSNRFAIGKIWPGKEAQASHITNFVEVGNSLSKWGVA